MHRPNSASKLALETMALEYMTPDAISQNSTTHTSDVNLKSITSYFQPVKRSLNYRACTVKVPCPKGFTECISDRMIN